MIMMESFGIGTFILSLVSVFIVVKDVFSDAFFVMDPT